MHEKQIAHLTMIQAAISRMAGNSAMLKGWAVTLMAATFALAAKDANVRFILIAYVPIVAFWILDGYYLGLERRYRDLYTEVTSKPEDEIDFNMDTSAWAKIHGNAACAFVNLLFYGVLGGIVLLVLYFFPRLGP